MPIENKPVSGRIFLIPVNIAECPADRSIPEYNIRIIKGLKLFFVENPRSARRFLSSLKAGILLDSLELMTLDKNTLPEALDQMISRVLGGEDAGILSESGNPGIADPGGLLVRLAHENGIQVVPLIGPSSILLALIASGLNGQHFAFHGYLPIQPGARKKKITELEAQAARTRQTQIFMETPYRNEQLMSDLLKCLHPDTLLCLASDLTGPGERILTLPVKEWAKNRYPLNKIPAVFLLNSAAI